MLAGMLVLAAVVVLFGLIPQAVGDRMILPAVNALLDRDGYIAAVLGTVL